MARCKEADLPFGAQTVISSLKRGQVLCYSHRVRPSGKAERVFTFEPSGKKVAEKDADTALASGLLAPRGDGLFEAETSQTWELAR
jgi:hypothetical protein